MACVNGMKYKCDMYLKDESNCNGCELNQTTRELTYNTKATNGDIFNTIFPQCQEYKTNGNLIGIRPAGSGFVIWFDIDWWNSKYEEKIDDFHQMLLF